MSITLGSYTFDATHTSVQEAYEEVGGSDARVITVKGLVVGMGTAADIEAALDAILDAASVEDYSAALSIRSGRQLWVRRNAFTREVSAESRIGSFTLELYARNPFEESVAEHSEPWAISASGATLAVSSAGNVFAQPLITLVATGDVVNPAVSDGTRTIAYQGTVSNGSTLIFDGVANTVTLDGDDVTPYSTGLFPRIDPDGTTLTYTDDASSSHTATATVAYRDRWW